MNYEEKYKEALEKARIYREHLIETGDDTNEIEYIFSELINEDERIRKEILSVVKQFDKNTTLCGKNYDYNKWITWLEKQGNKQVTDFSNIKTWKFIVDAVLTKEKGIGQYLDSSITETIAKELLERFGNIEQWYGLEKQDKQNKKYLDIIIGLWELLDKIDTYADLKINGTNQDNPFRKIEHITQERHNFVKSDGYNLFIDNKQITNQTYTKHDTVKPKFKVGDWITNGEYTWKVTDIKSLDYILQSPIYGDTTNDTISYVDEHFHLWTIQDAKDGDVLLFEGYYNSIVLFQGIGINYQGIGINYHCKCDLENYSLNIQGDVACLGTIKNDAEHYHPATKEQRDLLFQKMHEAGYTWNAETKKLIKDI